MEVKNTVYQMKNSVDVSNNILDAAEKNKGELTIRQ